MSDIIIRDARIEDLDELANVRHMVWETTYRGIYDDEVIDNFDYQRVKDSFKDKIGKQHIMFKVALDDDKIIGYVCFGKMDNPYKDIDHVLKYIHILQDYQGMGLGKLFFNMIIDHARNNGIDEFYVVCNKYNVAAHKYYEKMGGQKSAVVDGRSGNKQDDHVIYTFRVGE